MVGDLAALAGGNRLEAVGTNQLVQQLGVVHDLVLATKLRVLILEGVVAVGAGDHNLALLRRHTLEDLGELLDILLGEHLEEELVTGAASRITGTTLSLGENCVLHTSGVEHLRDGLGGLLGIVVVGTGTADPEEVLGVVEALDVLAPHRNDHAVLADFVDPVGTGGGVLAPRVALGLQVLEQAGQLSREVRLHQDLVTTHIDDVVDVLNINRALLHAGTTVGARPQHVLVNHTGVLIADQRLGQQCGTSALTLASTLNGLAGEQVRSRGVSMVTQLVDQQLRAQWLGGVPRRALLLAATTFSTGGEVQQGLPGVVGDHTGAHGIDLGVGLFQVDDLTLGSHRLSSTQGVVAVGVALEQNVGERQEAVPCHTPGEVTADDEEPDHTGEQLNQGEDGDELGRGGQQLSDAAGDKVDPGPHVHAGGAVVAIGGELGSLDHHHAQALNEDHSFDEVGSLSVGAVEAAQALFAQVGLADNNQRQNTQGGAETKDLVDKVPGGEVTQDGPTASGPEGLDVGLEPDQRTQQEADHDKPVGHGDAGLLGHLRVADDLSDRGPDAGAPVTSVTVRFLAHHDGLHHMSEALDEDEPAGQGQEDADYTDGECEAIASVHTPRRLCGEIEHAHDVPFRLAQPG